MSELIFPCPSCNQNIQCDPSVGGQQLVCPLCNANVTAPASAGTPKQVAKLGVASTSSHGQKQPPAQAAMPQAAAKKVSALDNTVAKQKQKKIVNVAIASVIVLALAGGVVYLVSNPDKFKELKEKVGLGPKKEEAASEHLPCLRSSGEGSAAKI